MSVSLRFVFSLNAKEDTFWPGGGSSYSSTSTVYSGRRISASDGFKHQSSWADSILVLLIFASNLPGQNCCKYPYSTVLRVFVVVGEQRRHVPPQIELGILSWTVKDCAWLCGACVCVSPGTTTCVEEALAKHRQALLADLSK